MFHNPRLNRLFAADGKCFDLALDHGVFGNPAFLAGIEDLPDAVATAMDAAPDAIQLGVGQAHLLQSAACKPVAGKPGAGKPAACKSRPALVLRIDVANVYGDHLPSQLFCLTLGSAVEQAVRADAAAVVLNLFEAPGQTELYRQCLANIAAVKPECERFGMPLMIEPLALEPGACGNYESSGDAVRIVTLVRQAVELGADLIKCDPPANPADFHRAVEAASGRPVLARGGGRIPEETVFLRTRELLQQGARGIVYGRNIIQHPRPRQMTRAFMAIVHQGAGVDEAMAILNG
jgi:DhnA family fructose-bisphosphate aldolase class Ia